MKKAFITLLVIVLFLLISIGLMFKLNICPPKGPWPTPPWCQADFVKYEYEVNVSPSHLSQIKAVNMFDTWGRNYNMSMIETTQANISESFSRVQSLGASEIYIHDFDRAVYEGETDFSSTKYEIVDEIFLNDMRDESISQTDLEKLVAEAHSRNMKLGIKRNISFVNIGKYIEDGLKGNISQSVTDDYNEFNKQHSEEWIKDYFSKWQKRLIEKGEMYQKAGVDIMSISPSFQEPTFAGQEKLVNEEWKKLIAELRKVFKGQIMVDINIYGLVDGNNGLENWNLYNYFEEADILEVKIYNILSKYQKEDMKESLSDMIEEINNKAQAKNIKVSLFFAPSSYKNGINAGPVEVLDYNNEEIKKLEKDYDEQVMAFNYFFQSVKDKKNIERINVGNFNWDDALDPEVKPRLSLSAGFRNKPAEKVIEAWYNEK